MRERRHVSTDAAPGGAGLPGRRVAVDAQLRAALLQGLLQAHAQLRQARADVQHQHHIQRARQRAAPALLHHLHGAAASVRALRLRRSSSSMRAQGAVPHLMVLGVALEEGLLGGARVAHGAARGDVGLAAADQADVAQAQGDDLVAQDGARVRASVHDVQLGQHACVAEPQPLGMLSQGTPRRLPWVDRRAPVVTSRCAGQRAHARGR